MLKYCDLQNDQARASRRQRLDSWSAPRRNTSDIIVSYKWYICSKPNP